jgi:hypothetical protein
LNTCKSDLPVAVAVPVSVLEKEKNPFKDYAYENRISIVTAELVVE